MKPLSEKNFDEIRVMGGAVFRIPALIFTVIMMSGCEKAKVDALMGELCKKDGRAKVYEKVPLPNDRFTQYGDIKFFETWNISAEGFRFQSSCEKIRSKNPTLTRYTYTVIRDSDKKALGTYVVYSRVGGDILWKPGPDSSKTCPIDANSTQFLRTIFVRKN